MHIRQLDLQNADEVRAYYTSFRDAMLEENDDRPMWSESEMLSHIVEPVGEETVAVAAFDDEGSLLGGALIFYPLLDNLTMAFVELFVAPRYQRRGVGSSLVEHVVERIRAHGRSVLLTNSVYGFDRREDHPYRRFAEKHGFALASTEILRRLDLPVADGQIQAWIDEAEPFHRDYRIESFTDSDVPEELLPSFCDMVNQLGVEAPTGDIEFEAEQMTPQLWHQRRDRGRKQGLHMYDTVAIDGTGSVVAVTTIGVPEGDPGKTHQWVTIVHKDHRGHRLGLAVKARNLRAVQDANPDRTSVHTSNAEVNGPMIDINERIGFKPIEILADFQRKFDG